MPEFSLVWHPRLDSSAASLATRRSPTNQHAWPYGRQWCQFYNFGGVLEPRYIVGAKSLDQ